MTDFKKRIEDLPIWEGKVHIEPLHGGITNHNFKVFDSKRQAVVRVGDDIIHHHVLRFHELAASKAAHQAGLSPEVLHSENGLLVLDFIEGKTFEPKDAQYRLEDVVLLLKRCHHEMPKYMRGPSVMFWVFHVVRDYCHTLEQAGRTADLRMFRDIADRLEAMIGPVSIVFGHNDMLAANIIDDGKRLWLIDWDYAGFNSPLFDIGGLASNNEIESEKVAELYFQKPVDDHLKLKLAAMTAASLLRETMWSMVSEQYATIDFDFVDYTKTNRRKLDAALLKLDEMTNT